MSLSLAEVMTLIGLLLATVSGWAGAWWAAARAAAGKIERLEERVNRRVDDTHSRINDLRRDVVLREDIMPQMQQLHHDIAGLRQELQVAVRHLIQAAAGGQQ